MDHEDDFIFEERKALRRILKEDQARRDQEAQALAARLTRELKAKYRL